MGLAADVVADGGPSAPVWAFLTAISLGIIGILGQQIAAKRAANEAKTKAAEAAVDAKQASTNTANIANGFAGGVDRQLSEILRNQVELHRSFLSHIEWHQREEKK